MKAYQFTAPGLDNLVLADLPDRDPGPGEVRFAVKAASVNFRDLVVSSGKYPARWPIVPLSDGVGVVEAVGAGVTRFKAGDRVSPIYASDWLSGPPSDAVRAPALGGDVDGVLRQAMVAHEKALVAVPGHLSDAEAATLTVAGVTAWSALVEFGRVKPGDTVLLEGTGGVSLFALQFAKLAGARVAIISSSDEKLERARALGADVTVNYTAEPEWGAAVQKATGGVDIIVETIGAETLAKALQAAKTGARVAQIGLRSGPGAALPLQFVIPRAVTIQGILVGSRETYEAMNRAIALHKLQPVVDKRFGFGELAPALGLLAKGGHFGKIVLDVG